MVNGDPLGVEPLASVMWLREVAAGYDPGRDEYGCIIWPFKTASRSGYGAAHRTINGKFRNYAASRWLCEMIHGDPPDDGEWHAAHECGRGHCGCTTPEHLSWKTPVGNNADKKRHGTQSMGETHQWAKLTEATVRAILLDTRAASEVAADHGVAGSMVTRLRRGERWRHIYDEIVASGHEIPQEHGFGRRLDGKPPKRMTEEMARSIFYAEEPVKVLAERYCTSLSNIRSIKKGITWRHAR
jgi:hypothetical protein